MTAPKTRHRAVVIGGAGVFGQRLAEMLLRDGHDVWIAGRSPGPLQDIAARLGATALVLDRGGDLAPLWPVGADVIIDAAGPFHAYGADPYRLARAAIARGINYVDLADDPDFCAGISALDDAARAAGVFALSGVSSVPALSSSVVAALAGDQPIDAIQSAILPGNRAPRGRAVVESILHQAGRPMVQWVDGQQRQVRSWSDPQRFDLGQGLTRRGYVIGVPDQTLFPAFFGARTVTFHAGLELGLMNRGLALLGWARARLGLPIPVTAIYHAARLFAPFGTDAGGMVVTVVVADGTRRQWRLRVRRGEGPYIPGVMARAVLRDLAQVPAGARPALAELALPQVSAAMADLAVETETLHIATAPLFERVLGERFTRLPRAVRNSHQTHAPRRWVGTARIDRGNGWWPRLIAAVMRFPPAARAIAVTVTKVPQDGGEVWTRDFGGHVFRSRLAAGRQGLTERFGPMTFDIDLQIAADALHFPVSGGRFLGIRMPRWLLPKSIACETAENGIFHFDVALHAPLTGQMIVHYRGSLTRQDKKG